MQNCSGSQVGGYLVRKMLGAGGEGTVFVAEDIALKRLVALKFDGDTSSPEYFLREGRNLAEINHPNVVSVYSAFESGQHRVLAMEYLHGGTLEDRLPPNNPMPLPEANRIAEALLSGLSELHRHNILHRDLKPSNVGFSQKGIPKLFDFGLSKIVGEVTSLCGTESALKGTLLCLSPEQFKSSQPDFRSEVFSFGVMHYRMLTAAWPFTGDDMGAVVYRILNVDPTPPATLRPEIPQALSDIVMRALHKNPDKRFQTAEEYLRALKLAAAGERPNPPDVTSRPSYPPELKRPSPGDWYPPDGLPLWVLLVVVCFAIVGTALGGLIKYNNIDWETLKHFGTVERAVLHEEPVAIPASVAGEYADVVVSYTVNGRGRAGEITIARSSGNPTLDNSVVAALKKWRFRPKRDFWRVVEEPRSVVLAGTKQGAASRTAGAR